MEEKKMKKVTESEPIPEFQESIKNMPENIKQKVDAKLKAITDTCTLTDFELVQACEKWIDRLCKSGGDAWTLEVPVNMNRDPDMLFTELIRRFSNPQPGAAWVSGAPKERKLYHARFKGHLSDLIHDGVIEPVTDPRYWQAIASGVRISIKDTHIVEYLDESPAAGREEDAVNPVKFHKWLIENNWEEHSSGRYWHRSKNRHDWPPDETCEEYELVTKFKQQKGK